MLRNDSNPCSGSSGHVGDTRYGEERGRGEGGGVYPVCTTEVIVRSVRL